MTDSNTEYTTSIEWGNSASTDGNWTIDTEVFGKGLSKVYGDYKRTKKKLDSERKQAKCGRCGDRYFVDEGIGGGYCSLDCKYIHCIIEEEKDNAEKI